MEDYEQLFKEIQELSDKHKKEDLFNGFMALNVGADETKHSGFIAMLMNPKGIHKQGDSFLKLFKSQISELNEFEHKNVIIECEKQTTKGRRIDIALWNDKQIIIIENKFWASDQSRQLIDYYNYGLDLKEEDKNVILIYLTPYGKLPSSEALGNDELPVDKVICISYEKHILSWLEACVANLDSTQERLKVNLEMYIDLIRTVIKRDKYMNEIFELLKKNEGEKIVLAINLLQSFQGRNLMKELDKVKSFKMQIINAAGNSGVDNPYDEPDSNYLAEIVLQNEDETVLGTIYFEDSEIYVSDSNEVPLNEFKIDTKNIYDANLQNLLTNNTEGLSEWMYQIVYKLKSIKK